MDARSAGFREIEHTADWALEVWAADLEMLFAQAAAGMYWLMQTSLSGGPRVERALELEAPDVETLLVSFLSDLLYLGETEGLAFDQFDVHLHERSLHALVHGAPAAEHHKEIKAVTFHNLAVRRREDGFFVTIVFDV